LFDEQPLAGFLLRFIRFVFRFHKHSNSFDPVFLAKPRHRSHLDYNSLPSANHHHAFALTVWVVASHQSLTQLGPTTCLGVRFADSIFPTGLDSTLLHQRSTNQTKRGSASSSDRLSRRDPSFCLSRNLAFHTIQLIGISLGPGLASTRSLSQT
jgi:hypothetical protein